MENVVLLADENSRAWDFAKKIQEYIRKEKCEEVKLYDVPISFFRNNELQIDPPENIRKKDVYFIHDSSKNPQQWWIELLLIKDMVLGASASSLTFVLPNMLYSRQDRKVKSRVPISARALATSISLGTTRIITMDLHAPQIQGFYPATTPLDNLYSAPEVVNYLKNTENLDFENLVVVSPDMGGATRAESFAKRIGSKHPIALIDKRREKPGEIGQMRIVGDVSNKNVLVVDDLIDSGGTLCSAANLLKQNGANKLFCYATHGLFTKGTFDLCSCFEKIFVSNTHNQEGNNVTVIDVSSVFAEAIFRAQKGYSLSQLFK